jgi:hypothetical protein
MARATAGRTPRDEHRRLQLAPRAVHRRHVERARELAGEQRVAHRGAHVHRPTLRCASAVFAPTCGREDHVRRAAQRVVGGERLGRVHVERRAAQLPRLERGEQRRVVDDAAAGEVGDDRAGAQARQLAPPDQPARLVGERRVHGDHVRLVEQRLERLGASRVAGGEARVGHVRIVGHHVHAEGVRPVRHLAADAPEPHDAERLPVQLAAHQRGAVPPPLAHALHGVRELPQQRQHDPEEQLGHGDGVARGRVDHRDAERRGDVHRHVVHAHAGPPDDAQPRAPRSSSGEILVAERPMIASYAGMRSRSVAAGGSAPRPRAAPAPPRAGRRRRGRCRR